MQCDHCEAQAPETAKFCPACGHRLNSRSLSSRRDAAMEVAGKAVKGGKFVADKTASLSRKALDTDKGKNVAACAIAGAVLAAPVPFVSMAAGAVVGAAFGMFRKS